MNAIRRCINVLILFGLFASSAVVAVPLYVTMPDNSTLTLDIALTDTVESVKEKIALTENIAVYKQKLKFNGVWLVNENALNSNVNPVAASSTLQLIINSPPVVTIPNQGSVAIVDLHYFVSFASVDDDGDEITWSKKETVDYQFPTWLTFYDRSYGTGVRFTPLVEHIGDHNVCFIADDGQEESENCYVLTVKPKPIKFSVVSFDFFEDIPAALDLSDIELTGSEDGQITLKLHPEAGSLSGFTEGDDIGSGVNISLDSSSLLLIGTYAEIIIYLSQAERLLFNAPLNFSGTIDLEITLFDENDNLFTLYTELIVTPINDPPVTKIGELRERFYCDKQYCKVAGNNVDTRTPGGLYHTKDGRFIYSIDSYDDELMVMQRDPDSGYTFDSITHEIPRSQFFGDQFYALRMRMSFDETKLFVLGEKGLMVLNRDSETGAVTRLYTEKIDSNLDMLITKDGKNVYLLTDTGINTYAYDDVAHTLTLSSTLPLQSGSFSFEMTDDEKFIHVANAIDDTLIVIQRESNGADLTVKHTYVDSINGIVGLKFTPHDYSPGARLPSFVLHTTFDNKSLYVLSNVENSLTLFDRNLDTGNLTYKKRYSSADQGFESVELGSFITSSADSSNIYLLSGSGFPLSIYNRHSISGELSLRDRFSNDRDDNVRNIQDPRFLLVINDDRNYYIADHNIWGFIELSDTKNNFSYTENSLPVTLNTSEQITDIDNTELMSLTFRISNLVNSGDEILGFVGELPASIIADDYDAQAGELRFSGLSSIGNYSQLLSRITYFNASTRPTSEQRIITVVVNDGVDDSETDYIYIDIDEVFDDPVEQSITVTTDNIYIDIDGVFDDPVEQSITVTTTSSGGSLSLLMLLILAGMAIFRKPKLLGMLGIMLATNASANNLFTCNITPNNECKVNTPWYLGGQIGLGITTVSHDSLNTAAKESGLSAESFELDDDGMAFSLFAGYQFNQYFALELGYLDLGDRSISFNGLTQNLDAFYDVVDDIYPQTGHGILANGIFSYPVNDRWRTSVKLGVFNWKRDYLTHQSGNQVGKASTSNTDFSAGIEGSYAFNDRIQIYAAVDHFLLDDQSANTYGIGFRYFLKNHQAPVSIAPPEEDEFEKTNIDESVIEETALVLKIENPVPDSYSIYFFIDTHEVVDVEMNKVDHIAKLMHEDDSLVLNMVGQASSVGDSQRNMELSNMRVHQLALHLLEKGIAADRVRTGYIGDKGAKSHEKEQQVSLSFQRLHTRTTHTEVSIPFGIFSDKLTDEDLALLTTFAIQIKNTDIAYLSMTSYEKPPGHDIGLKELAYKRVKVISDELKNLGVSIPIHSNHLVLDHNNHKGRQVIITAVQSSGSDND